MYSLKGFITINSLEDNAVDSVAPLGELSTHSRTYTREIGKYTDSNYPGISLVSFSSKDTDQGMVTAPQAFVNNVLTIANWVYQEAVAGRSSDDETAFLSSLNSTFAAEVQDVQAGQMVTDGTHWMPEYLIWTVPSTVDGSDGDNEVRVWFADQAFKAQYDEYEILVVPPIDTLDDFFKQANEVGPLLEQQTTATLINKVESVAGGDPYTYLRTESYEWISSYDSDNTLQTNWAVIIYGQAGDNVDFIRQALTEYVLDNSEHTREEWVEVIPELFRVTEFIVRPLWGQYSIPNQTLQAGIYSPIGRVRDMEATARNVCVGYPDSHVEQNLEYVNFPYKSAGLLVCGGPENLDGITRLSLQYSDYFVSPTTGNDFGRMSPDTQEWVIQMHEAIVAAETAREFTSLPEGYSNVIRDGILYITFRRDNVNWLIVAKSNYESN